MKLFENLYMPYISQFDNFVNMDFVIKDKDFQQKFLIDNNLYQITIKFPEASQQNTSYISNWIYHNPFIFSKLLQNKEILRNYLIRNEILPNLGDIMFFAPCCRTLCIHSLYSFYIFDHIIDDNPELLLQLCGIDITLILNKLASSLIQRTTKLTSERILGDEILNHILDIKWE